MRTKAFLTWLVLLFCAGHYSHSQTVDIGEVRQVVISEYKVAFIKNDGTAWAPYWSGAGTQAVPFNGNHKFADGDGGLYNILFRKENGDVYAHNNSNRDLEFLEFDASGAPFKALNVECYLRTYIAVRDDGTIWSQKYNSYKWFGADVNLVNDAWTKIPGQPAGVKFKKISKGGATGLGQLIALATNGDVWTLNDNSTTWVKKTLPAPAQEVHGGLNGFYVALVDGKPYGWGQGKYLGVNPGNISTYQDLSTAWGLGSHKIISMALNDNTIHYITDDNKMWGLGDNMQGEVGLGWELVNRKELYAGAWYVWNWIGAIQGNYDQNGFITKPQRVRPDKLFNKVFGGNYYSYYKYAQEIGTGDLYSWGRNKGAVLMSGKGASNESAIPNSMDVLAPTKVDVFKVVIPSPSAFVPGSADAGEDQSITESSTKLTGSGIPGKTKSWSYAIAAYKWRKLSGPFCSIQYDTAATTTVSGMTTGTYTFELKVTDNNTATITDTVKIVVNVSGNIPPVANAGADISIALPVIIAELDGSASKDPDGSISSYKWEKISGPTIFSLLNNLLSKASLTGLIVGKYEFKLTVTDNKGATGVDTVAITVGNAPNKAPVAKAGSDLAITLPSNSVSLDGSASADSDGTIATYAWTRVSGPTQFSIGSASSAKTNLTNLVQGTYQFELVVKDNDGASAKDTVKITVNPAPNKSPTALAGTDITVVLPSNAALNGSASADSDGSIASYSWKQISGPAASVISAAASAQTNVVFSSAGVYEYELTVIDNSGASSKDTVKVTVQPPANKAPVANAGSNQNITLPETAALNGSASADSDGSIASYSWKQISGPATSALTNSAAAQTLVSFTAAGMYEFELTVTDNKGATGKDVVAVTVNTAANKTPVANAGTDQVITLPQTASLNGSASADADGTISTYSWKQISGPGTSTISTAASAQTSVSFSIAGVYQFELTVTDNSGVSAKDVVKVTVNPVPNKVPVANAGTDQVITLPQTASLNGSASADADGTISTYSWKQISGPGTSAISTAGSVQTTVSFSTAGVYEFELTVTDNSGVSAKDVVKITVNPVPNKAPVANAGADQIITLPQTATLNGAASADADGTISTYSWKQISGPGTSTISTAGSVQTTVSFSTAGVYEFELTVTDNSGVSAKDVVKISVNPAANKAPIANAGPDAIYPSNTISIALDGSKSIDPDGYIASYSWAKVEGPSPFTITFSNTAKPVLASPKAGTYVFELTVTDNSGAVAIDKVTIVVEEPVQNMAPNVVVQDTIVLQLPKQVVTLDGSASHDVDGSIVKYEWSLVEGPSSPAVPHSNSPVIIVNNLVAGKYVFELKATDNEGSSGNAFVVVLVKNSTHREDQHGEAVVFPNPVHGTMYMTIEGNTNGPSSIVMFNAEGKSSLTKSFVKSSYTQRVIVNVSALKPGIYVVVVNIGNDRRIIRKIVKM